MMASLWAGVMQVVETLGGAIVAAIASTKCKRLKLLIVGLGNAGKTTLLHCMRNPDPASSPASTGTDIRLAVDVGVASPYSSSANRNYHSNSSNGPSTRTHHVRLVLDAIDLGGLRYRCYPGGVRRLWRDSLVTGDVDGVVFVVDAADHERLRKAAESLGDLLRLLREIEEGSTGRGVSMPMPVLVLGNKIDSPSAVGEQELRDLLGLPASGGDETRRIGEEGEALRRPVELFMCSVHMGVGYRDGFGWLASHV